MKEWKLKRRKLWTEGREMGGSVYIREEDKGKEGGREGGREGRKRYVARKEEKVN